MSPKVRTVLCLAVAVVAAGAVTVCAYIRALPKETVRVSSPSEETAVGEHEEEKAELSDDTVVYKTPTGKKYHLTKDCRYLSQSKTIVEATKKEAVEQGLEPCSGCVE